MKPEPKPSAPVPLGPSLDSTDAELDAAAEISIEDIQQAQQTAKRHGRGTDLTKMLDAEAE